MNLHHEFCVPSWMVEIRGNRLTPGVTRKPPTAIATQEIDGTEDEAASDPPSGTELGGEVSLTQQIQFLYMHWWRAVDL